MTDITRQLAELPPPDINTANHAHVRVVGYSVDLVRSILESALAAWREQADHVPEAGRMVQAINPINCLARRNGWGTCSERGLQQAAPAAEHPWSVHDGGAYLASSDFRHDAILRLDGDFESDDAKLAFAEKIRDTLNASQPPSESSAAEPTEEWSGQSNIESPFNACMHKGYCVQLKAQPPSGELPPYSSTDFGWTYSLGRELEPQEKRLMSLLVSAFGSDHPAVDDMAHLMMTRSAALASKRAVPMTLVQIGEMAEEGVFLGTITEIVRAVEAFHNIKD